MTNAPIGIPSGWEEIAADAWAAIQPEYRAWYILSFINSTINNPNIMEYSHNWRVVE